MSRNSQAGVLESRRLLFGYGSLIWRPDFEFVTRRSARVDGYARRLWQRSPDHRGTPDAPGLVVTLLADPESSVVGVVYELEASVWDPLMRTLDVREQAGYVRREVMARLDNDTKVRATTYISEGREHFAGELGDAEIAAVVGLAEGPSGTNLEYVSKLQDALTEMGAPDAHLASVLDLVSASAAQPGESS